MLSNYHILFLFLFLLFFHICSSIITLSASSSDTESEYNKWVTWNIKRYHRRRRSTLEAAKPAFDYKLKNAEMNSVTITVSQNGTANFTTIGEAISTIPPHNTRRVVISIKPGVYRYV